MLSLERLHAGLGAHGQSLADAASRGSRAITDLTVLTLLYHHSTRGHADSLLLLSTGEMRRDCDGYVLLTSRFLFYTAKPYYLAHQ